MAARSPHLSSVLILFQLQFAATVAVTSAARPFPLLFDIGGRGLASVPDLDALVAATPRVQMHRVMECPHPCGLLPAIDPATGASTNGGLPQLANLTLHLATLVDTFDKYVARNATGWLDLDFESWPPLWDRASPTYQNASIALAKRAHPDYSDGQLLAAATRAWEVAAMDLLVMTVEFVKKIRPGLNISMYSYPDRVYWNGYNSTAGPGLRKDNDRLFDLFCVLDGLFPSVYQFYDSTGKPGTKATNAEYIFSNVAEAVRIANQVPEKCPGKAADPPPPVWVYTWHRYHSASQPLVSDADERMYWEQSYAAGATGLVLWGYEPTNASAEEFGRWWRDDFTPLLNAWSPPATREAPVARAPKLAADSGKGAALTPPLGWQNWNGFQMRFNASLFRAMAGAMKQNGLLAAGYNLISAGGSTYPHQGLPPRWNSTNDSNIDNVIVRNSSGFYEIDPARFPGPGSTPACLDQGTLRACLANHSRDGRSWSAGDPAACGCKNGNAGMAALSAELRAMGFRWGSYSNEAGCKVAACNTSALNASKFRGFVDEDFDLMVNTWHSEYIMVDSVGNEPPYPKDDPLQRWWHWPRMVLSNWAEKVEAFKDRPLILHSCHNGCGTPFSGPTLKTAVCNASDRAQLWSVPTNDSKGSTTAPWPSGYLRDAGEGLCVGCGAYAPAGGPCANDALEFRNGSGYGAGMAACGQECPYCTATQQWNYSQDANHQMLLRADGSCLEVLQLAPVGTTGQQQVVVQQKLHCNGSAVQQWKLGKSISLEGETFVQLVSMAAAGAISSSGENTKALQPQHQQQCLSSTAGAHVTYPLDPWCAKNFNMWRTSTDTLQIWSRTVVQIDSLVGLGKVSGPGHWGFGDCLELGVGGMCQGLLTWEESKTHLAIFAVASQPLFLGNDVRAGVMQQRLLDILLNPDMLAVNQEYDTELAFAGDRMWTAAVGKELWAKPLPGKRVGAVLWNRNGTVVSTKTIGICGASEAPCTDNYTASVGAQRLSLHFDTLPVEWLLRNDDDDGRNNACGADLLISCAVRDIFAGETGKKGADLGRFSGTWDAGVVPPHGSRFVLLSNCRCDDTQQAVADF